MLDFPVSPRVPYWTDREIDYALQQLRRIDALMTQNDSLSQAFGRHDAAVADSLEEIKTEISDLAAALAQQAGMQQFADRLNASSAKLEAATAELRADNAPASEPEPEPTP